jgi:hypothetical protein
LLKEAIGGWLLYFYCQIYVWVASLLVSSISTAAALYPRWSANATGQPSAAVFAVLPEILGFAGVAIVATGLLEFRSWLWVQRLRMAISSGILLVGISVVVDFLYFSDAVGVNPGRWIVLCLWLIYFSISVRVRLVFLTKIWGEVPIAKLFG